MADDQGPPPDPNHPRDNPFGGDNPFSNLPMFGDLAKALAGQGPLNWEAARQFAALSSSGGISEPNVEPSERIAFTQLAQIVAMHVRDVCDVDLSFPEITPVTASVWAQRTLEAYRPLFTEMATSLSHQPDVDDDAAADPMMAMMAGLSKMMAPSMMGMAIGSMVGRMAQHAFGQYDLPIPRADQSLQVVPASVSAFAADWNIAADEMRLWVIAQELIGHVVFSLGTVHDDLTALVRAHVGAFRADPSAVTERLAELDVDDVDGSDGDPMEAIQRAFSDPSVVLGAVQSAEQRALEPRLDAALGAVIGCVDYLVDAVAVRLIGGNALQIAEAVRRRRAEHGREDVYVQRLLGLKLHQEHVQRGKQFIAGVVERVGEAKLCALWSVPGALPTPAEFEAPGLWVARLEL
ncbi:MAG TPA: zinc-dependent metalloprotease [Ilumatobacteraceae bacterium]|nr:zinc-dependent metalloprotease [Ilumatobacteraceae bacterium]